MGIGPHIINQTTPPLNRSFTAKETRMLRVAVGSFLDLLTLVVDTIREFGP